MAVLEIITSAWESCKSAKVFPGNKISLCSSALSNHPPHLAVELVGVLRAGAVGQKRCQFPGSALCRKQSRKPAASSGARSWHGELKGAWKAEINLWQRRVWHARAIKAIRYKKHWPVLLFYEWALLAGFLCLGNWNAAAFWSHESQFYNSV